MCVGEFLVMANSSSKLSVGSRAGQCQGICWWPIGLGGLIINVHCSEESAFQVGEFINNFQFVPIHSGGWFVVRFSRC